MKKPLHQNRRAVTRARKKAGLTMTALAEAVGCSLSLISEIESGSRNARPHILATIAKVLGCDVSSLQARREPGRTATPPADVDLPVRDAERADTDDVPQMRDREVVGGD